MSEVEYSVSIRLIVDNNDTEKLLKEIKDLNEENGIYGINNLDDLLIKYFSRSSCIINKRHISKFINKYNNIIHQTYPDHHNSDVIKFDNTFFEDENYKDIIDKLYLKIRNYLEIGSNISIKINNKSYRDYMALDNETENTVGVLYVSSTHMDKYRAKISKKSNKIINIFEYTDDIAYDWYYDETTKHLSTCDICKYESDICNSVGREESFYVDLPLAQIFISLIEKGFNPIPYLSSYYSFQTKYDYVSIYIGTNENYPNIEEIERIFNSIIKNTNFEMIICSDNNNSYLSLDCKFKYFKDVFLDIINFRIKNLNKKKEIK